MKLLVLGSKEYPMGTNVDDPLPSGGIEVYVDHLLRELSKGNIEITVITRRFKSTKAYERGNNIIVYRVPWIKGFFFRNISYNFAAFLQALRVDFDIIQSNGPIATLFGIALRGAKKRPVVATPHGLALRQPQYNKFVRFLLSRIEKFAYSSADSVVFLSEEEKEEFYKKLGFLPKNWRVIPPGIKLEDFETVNGKDAKREFDLDKITLTFVGRLIGVKGIGNLIDAVKMVKNGFKVLIVGDGPERMRLEKRVLDNELGNKIIFAGSRDDVPDILAITDIFVLPSISEGLPIALLEAMASGCACVVTDIGLPVKNGETALVVPPGDPEGLARGIDRLLADKEFRKKLGENAREEAKKYSWKGVVEKYMEVFNSFQERKL